MKIMMPLAAAIILCGSSSASAMDKQQFTNWLSSGWQEVKSDGSEYEVYYGKGCLTHKLPLNLVGKLKGQSITRTGFHGVLAFSSEGKRLIAVSAYVDDPKEHSNVFYNEAAELTAEVALRDGAYVLKLSGQIPGLKAGYTVVPTANHEFNLVPDDAAEKTRFFKRCEW